MFCTVLRHPGVNVRVKNVTAACKRKWQSRDLARQALFNQACVHVGHGAGLLLLNTARGKQQLVMIVINVNRSVRAGRLGSIQISCHPTLTDEHPSVLLHDTSNRPSSVIRQLYIVEHVDHWHMNPSIIICHDHASTSGQQLAQVMTTRPILDLGGTRTPPCLSDARASLHDHIHPRPFSVLRPHNKMDCNGRLARKRGVEMA
jgi:hypothetical protein